MRVAWPETNRLTLVAKNHIILTAPDIRLSRVVPRYANHGGPHDRKSFAQRNHLPLTLNSAVNLDWKGDRGDGESTDGAGMESEPVAA